MNSSFVKNVVGIYIWIQLTFINKKIWHIFYIEDGIKSLPDRSAEDEVVNSAVSLQLSGDVEDVMFASQRNGERFAFHDAIKREFFAFSLIIHADDRAQLRDDVLHHRRRFGVDHSLGSSGQSLKMNRLLLDK